MGVQVPSCPPISRRLASEGTADPSDLRSLSLPGASPGAPTNLCSSSYGSAGRRVVNREQQTGSAQTRTALGVQVSPRRPFAGMPTGQANRACLLNSACLRASGASPRHSAIFRARSSKRAGGFITRIALDECLDPERYRTRVPFRTPEREAARAAQPFPS